MEGVGGLVSRARNGDAMRYTGTAYVNPTEGKTRLCLRTGTGPNDVVRYGLTSNVSASQYCGLRMQVKDGVAYLGRSETVTQTQLKTSERKTTTVTSAVSTSYSGSMSTTASTQTGSVQTYTNGSQSSTTTRQSGTSFTSRNSVGEPGIGHTTFPVTTSCTVPIISASYATKSTSTTATTSSSGTSNYMQTITAYLTAASLSSSSTYTGTYTYGQAGDGTYTSGFTSSTSYTSSRTSVHTVTYMTSTSYYISVPKTITHSSYQTRATMYTISTGSYIDFQNKRTVTTTATGTRAVTTATITYTGTALGRDISGSSGTASHTTAAYYTGVGTTSFIITHTLGTPITSRTLTGTSVYTTTVDVPDPGGGYEYETITITATTHNFNL